MPSRRYRTYKFRYSSDKGNDVVRIQREYLDANNEPITPITSLFLQRVVPNDLPFEPKKKSDMRHAISYILIDNNYGEFKAYIPYIEPNTILAHLREILAVQRVICIDYKGEIIDNAKSNNAGV